MKLLYLGYCSCESVRLKLQVNLGSHIRIGFIRNKGTETSTQLLAEKNKSTLLETEL